MRKDEFPIVDKLIKDSVNEVLDKIRAEIEEIAKPNEFGGRGNGKSVRYGLCKALEIIDKYKAESEE
jgi:N-acetylmuramic acid 6-phosphate (MurNAc-6-P) etherase